MSEFVDLLVGNLPLLAFLLLLLLVAGGVVLYLLSRIERQQRREIQGWVGSGLKTDLEALGEGLTRLEGEQHALREALAAQSSEIVEQLNLLRKSTDRIQGEVRELAQRSASGEETRAVPIPHRKPTPRVSKLRQTAPAAAADQSQILRQKLHRLPPASRVLLETSRVAATLIDQLRTVDAATDSLDREFASYSDLAGEFRSFSRRLHSRPSMVSSPAIPLATQFERLQAKLEEVESQHGPLPFFELLDASAGRPALDEARYRLMSLLKLEEIQLKVGDDVGEQQVDVADLSGQGTRRIVREVLARGYRHTDGTVLRPPKVVIELTD